MKHLVHVSAPTNPPNAPPNRHSPLILVIVNVQTLVKGHKSQTKEHLAHVNAPWVQIQIVYSHRLLILLAVVVFAGGPAHPVEIDRYSLKQFAVAAVKT